MKEWKEMCVAPVQSMDEVWPPTEGEKLVMETGGASTLEATKAAE
jgi:hypothetical protein